MLAGSIRRNGPSPSWVASSRPGADGPTCRGEAAVKAVLSLSGDREVNLGCALRAVSFNRPDEPDSVIEYSESDTTLLFFLFSLFTRLQRLGTVAAADIGAYMNRLDLSEAPVETDGERPGDLVDDADA